MKVPSDKLFRLIHSLTPAEKRYFSIFVRGRTDRDSKYLLLFDVMSKMDTFDDVVAQKKVYKSQASGRKKYPELKSYLYDLILKSLYTFDEQQASEARLQHLLQGTSVLFKRGEYDNCRDLLHKASKIARQYEAFTHIIEIVRWEKHLAYAAMDVDFFHRNLGRLLQEEATALSQMQQVSAYKAAFFQMYLAIKRGAQERTSDRLEPLKTIISQEIFQNKDWPSSHKSQVLYYRTLNLYHFAASENEQFYETGCYLILLLESQPHFLRENLSDYIAALSNLILSCGLLRKYDEVRTCLQKLRYISPLTEDDRRKIHRQYYTNLFALCIFTGAFEEARREMDHCRQESSKFDAKEYETTSFAFQYCVICFGCGDYNTALTFLNQWLNQPRSVEREDLQSLARILSLILHFEMGSHLLLDSLLRSAAHFMKVKNRFYDLEKHLIQSIAEAYRLVSRREQQQVFEKLHRELMSEPLASTARHLLQIFDLDAWLVSKIEGRSFAEIAQRRYEEGRNA